MDKWFITSKKADFYELGKQLGVDPVVARLLRNRDMTTYEEMEAFLHGDRSRMHDGALLKDSKKALSLLQDALVLQKKIRIIGDYDIDGVCSTFILVKALRNLGGQVDYAIPDRIVDGYGLNIRLVEEAIAAGTEVLMTCDNGISARDQIAYAKENGLTVIVTDHHEVPYEETPSGEKKYLIPNADAVIDPKQEDCPYPFPEICGGMVAYKLMEVLYRELGKELPGEFLEAAAFATVGDVMELKDENRIAVSIGLKAMQNSENLGLRTLVEACGLTGKSISAYTVGFVLGPCINATGRLDSAIRALELLLCEDIDTANRIAGELKAMNDVRKEMTIRKTEEATKLVETTELKNDRVLVIFLPDCHESLAGIIAGRIRERFNRPSFVFTQTEDGVKGSGRSIEAYHMFEEITKCKELLTKYGGHKMAAGLSMPAQNLDAFRAFLNANTTLTQEDLVRKVAIDMLLPYGYLKKELLSDISRLEPFGTGNPKPVFAMKDLRFRGIQILGKNRNVMRARVTDLENRTFFVTYFGDSGAFLEYVRTQFGDEETERLVNDADAHVNLSILYEPGEDRYRGGLSVVMTGYQ